MLSSEYWTASRVPPVNPSQRSRYEGYLRREALRISEDEIGRLRTLDEVQLDNLSGIPRKPWYNLRARPLLRLVIDSREEFTPNTQYLGDVGHPEMLPAVAKFVQEANDVLSSDPLQSLARMDYPALDPNELVHNDEDDATRSLVHLERREYFGFPLICGGAVVRNRKLPYSSIIPPMDVGRTHIIEGHDSDGSLVTIARKLILAQTINMDN